MLRRLSGGCSSRSAYRLFPRPEHDHPHVFLTAEWAWLLVCNGDAAYVNFSFFFSFILLGPGGSIVFHVLGPYFRVVAQAALMLYSPSVFPFFQKPSHGDFPLSTHVSRPPRTFFPSHFHSLCGLRSKTPKSSI